MLQAVGLITSRDQWWEKQPENQNIASRVEHTQLRMSRFLRKLYEMSSNAPSVSKTMQSQFEPGHFL